MFNWLFRVGDAVEMKDGKTGKVQGFKPEGFVDVRVPDGKGGFKTESRFGGNLTRKER